MNWILVVLSLAGNVQVIRRRRSGFALWTAANVGWIWVDIAAGVPEQAALFGAYLVLSIWGWCSWSDRGRVDPERR